MSVFLSVLQPPPVLWCSIHGANLILVVFLNELGKQICTEVIVFCMPSVIQGSEDKDSEKFPEEFHDAEWVGEKTMGEIDN